MIENEKGVGRLMEALDAADTACFRVANIAASFQIGAYDVSPEDATALKAIEIEMIEAYNIVSKIKGETQLAALSPEYKSSNTSGLSRAGRLWKKARGR